MIIHAAGESSPGNLPETTHAVALTCPDERALAAVAARLSAAGVRHRAIHEPDAPWCGALMAIGLEPGAKEALRRQVSSLPLLR